MTLPRPAVYLITGIPAAGKSTVAQLLAQRLARSVHVPGDAFRRAAVWMATRAGIRQFI